MLVIDRNGDRLRIRLGVFDAGFDNYARRFQPHCGLGLLCLCHQYGGARQGGGNQCSAHDTSLPLL